jgi:hypothetical protein
MRGPCRAAPASIRRAAGPWRAARPQLTATHPRTASWRNVLQGQGLNERQLALCDSFVYIPQYGPGTASLNVAVAASIVLHHFALFAGYPVRQREVGWGGQREGQAAWPRQMAGDGRARQGQRCCSRRAARAACERRGLAFLPLYLTPPPPPLLGPPSRCRATSLWSVSGRSEQRREAACR